MKCVEETRSIPKLILQKKFEMVQQMRGPEFVDCLRIYKEVHAIPIKDNAAPTPRKIITI